MDPIVIYYVTITLIFLMGLGIGIKIGQSIGK